MAKGDRLLLITGASVRSAAQSAVRAGYRPVCADLFGDMDLREVAEADVVSNYPDGFIRWSDGIFRRHGGLPFVYTGGLENHPGVVDEIAELHQLIGNQGESLQRVRDPRRLAECFDNAGVRFPLVTNNAEDANAAQLWVKRPKKGAAGNGIEIWTGGEPGHECILQEFIDGPSVSAIFVGNGTTAWLAGVTLQLVGFESLSAGRFGWCGSFGPIRLLDDMHRQVTRIGTILVEQFGLRGLFGVDCVVDEAQVVPIEVNPRYTGSVEVLERTSDWRAIETHVVACQDAGLPCAALLNQAGHGRICGKAVLFAAETTKPEGLDAYAAFLSDRPIPGRTIDKAHPVCSVFGAAGNYDQCISVWEANIERIARQLWGHNLRFDREIRRLWRHIQSYGVFD